MAVFSYRAVDKKGKEVKGVIEASSKSGAYALLKSKGIYPLELFEEKTEERTSVFHRIFRKYPSPQELVLFFRTLATLLESGIPIVDAVNSFVEGEEKNHLKVFYKKLVDGLKEGLSLSESLKRAGVNDPVILSLVSSGERSALLPKNLTMVAELLERRESIKTKVIQALIYPSVLLTVAFGVVVFMIVTVIPKVEAIYTTAKIELPLSTRFLLSLSSLVLNHYFSILFSLTILLLLFLFFAKRKKRYIDTLKLNFPLVGRLLAYAELTKFFTTFGDLLSAGVPAVEAYETASETLVNQVLKEEFMNLLPELERGTPLYKLLSEIPQVPGVVVQLIKAGENSGNLSEMSRRISKFLENEVNFKLKSLTSLLEPATMLIVGIVIGFVVYALLLPILSISTIKVF